MRQTVVEKNGDAGMVNLSYCIDFTSFLLIYLVDLYVLIIFES